MSYAIRNDLKGWRAVSSESDCSVDEHYSEGQPNPVVPDLCEAIRHERDRLLYTVYDPGVAIALRSLRLATTQPQREYINGRLAELDAYAVALQDVPQQPGFPETVTWPTIPTP